MHVINIHQIDCDWVDENLVNMESAAVRGSRGLSEHTTTQIA